MAVLTDRAEASVVGIASPADVNPPLGCALVAERLVAFIAVEPVKRLAANRLVTRESFAAVTPTTSFCFVCVEIIIQAVYTERV